MTERALLYVADPMCSWCWGFAPVISAVAARFSAQAPVTLLVGGLAPGATRLMDDANKATVRTHWDHVRAATGQPFDYGFFERQGFVYDTEPACRAVVLVRRHQPDRALEFLDLLHRSFYQDNRDVTNADTLAELACEFGVDRGTVASEIESEALRRETRDEFAFIRRLGVTGFPALIGFDGDSLVPITAGYRPREEVEDRIEAWIANRPSADG